MRRIQFLGLDLYGCHEALERLEDFVDRELNEEETYKVQQHLKICVECARKFAFEEKFSAELREGSQSVASAPDLENLKNRIGQMIQRERDNNPDSSQ